MIMPQRSPRSRAHTVRPMVPACSLALVGAGIAFVWALVGYWLARRHARG